MVRGTLRAHLNCRALPVPSVRFFFDRSVDPVLLKKHSTDTMDSIIKAFELAFPRPLMLQQDIVSRCKSLKGKPGWFTVLNVVTLC